MVDTHDDEIGGFIIVTDRLSDAKVVLVIAWMKFIAVWTCTGPLRTICRSAATGRAMDVDRRRT